MRELINRDNKIQRKKQSTNDREGIPNSGWKLGCPFTRKIKGDIRAAAREPGEKKDVCGTAGRLYERPVATA